jgi:hypothetical protein
MRYFEMPTRWVADDTQNASVNFTNHRAQGEAKHTGRGIWAREAVARWVYRACIKRGGRPGCLFER